MSSLAYILKRGQRLLTDNSPAILTAIGASGVIGTAILAARVTPRASRQIEYAKRELIQGSGDEPLDVKLGALRTVQIVWKLYVPAALVGGTTIAAIIAANSISSRRNAAILSAFSIVETAAKEYREKVVEIVGEKKEQQIRDGVTADHIARTPVSATEVIIAGSGDVLCFDTLTARWFFSTMEKIRKAQNDINKQCLNDMYASQNDFYQAIGLPPAQLGEELGWRFDNMLDINFSVHLSQDGQPALALEYKVQPAPSYYKIN